MIQTKWDFDENFIAPLYSGGITFCPALHRLFIGINSSLYSIGPCNNLSMFRIDFPLPILSISSSLIEKYIAISFQSGVIVVYCDNQLKLATEVHTKPIKVKFSDRSLCFAVLNEDKSVEVYEIGSQEMLYEVNDVVDFVVVGSNVVCLRNNKLVYVEKNKEETYFTFPQGETPNQLTSDDGINLLCFSSNSSSTFVHIFERKDNFISNKKKIELKNMIGVADGFFLPDIGLVFLFHYDTKVLKMINVSKNESYSLTRLEDSVDSMTLVPAYFVLDSIQGESSCIVLKNEKGIHIILADYTLYLELKLHSQTPFIYKPLMVNNDMFETLRKISPIKQSPQKSLAELKRQTVYLQHRVQLIPNENSRRIKYKSETVKKAEELISKIKRVEDMTKEQIIKMDKSVSGFDSKIETIDTKIMKIHPNDQLIRLNYFIERIQPGEWLENAKIRLLTKETPKREEHQENSEKKKLIENSVRNKRKNIDSMKSQFKKALTLFVSN